MATVYGVNFTKYDQNVPKEMVNVAENGGRLRVQYDTYEASALEAGSTISVARIPKGARIWDAFIIADALGSGHTLSLGDSDDVDRFITATLFNTANKMVSISPRPTGTANAASTAASGTGIAAIGYEYTSETDIIITTASAAITGTIKTAVFYSVD